MFKNFLPLFATFMVAACTTIQHIGPKPVSMNENMLRVSDEKPAGYPRTFVEKVPNTNLCLQVTQDWRPDAYNGYRIWFHDEQRKTINCPPGQ